MTLEEIKELIALANEHGLAEIEFERDGTRVRIKRATTEQEVILPPPAQAAAPPPPPPPMGGLLPAPPMPPPSRTGRPAPPPLSGSGLPIEQMVYVKAPIVGTYFESPSPGAPPFVTVGDRVSKGQVLCIIESMKLMNEIESEISGVVMQKIAVNASPVQYGESLLAVRTD